MGCITFVFFAIPHLGPTTFQIDFYDGRLIPNRFSKEYRGYFLSSIHCAIIGLSVPIGAFLLMQIRIRSFTDLNSAIFGLQYSVASSALMHTMIASFIGGRRPNFFAKCNLDAKPPIGKGFETMFVDRNDCLGEDADVNYAFSSFPSGHSTAAFAGFIFLSLYLNAKLKVWSSHRSVGWKFLATYAPILPATIFAGLCTLDYSHHWYDVLGGAALGTTTAVMAYRMMYASVWDFRFNHIPLARRKAFKYGLDPASITRDGFRDVVWTRDVGWGDKSARPRTGAPFDSAGAELVDSHGSPQNQDPSGRTENAEHMI